jgi:hypothetical protein
VIFCTKSYTGLNSGQHIFSVTATDRAGNQEAAPPVFAWSVDRVAPVITAFTPANGTSLVNTASPGITVTFSEPVNPATLATSPISTATFKVTSGTPPILVSGTVSLDDTGTVATFTSSLPLQYGTIYTATVTTGVRDIVGNALATGSSWNFTTIPDGDINLDGRVDIADAMLALRVTVGRSTVSAAAFLHGDVAPLSGGLPASDSLIDGRDAMVILGRTLGIHTW